MAEQNTEDKVRSIIVDQLNVNPEQVTLEASFIDDLGCDSLDNVELIMAFEEAFSDEIDGEIPEADAEKLTSVGDVVRYITEKGRLAFIKSFDLITTNFCIYMRKDNMTPRVVVTGLGTINSHGVGIDRLWKGVVAGTSAIRRIQNFDVSDLTSKIGAEVIDFEVSDFMDLKEARRNDRFTHFAVASSRLAIADSKLEVGSLDSNRFGVYIGSGIGGLQTIHNQTARLIERGPKKVSPFMIPSLIGNIASGVVAIELGAKGPNFGLVSACSSATHSIGEAFNSIRNNQADVMIAGGSEAAVCQLGYAGFCSMKAMSTSFNESPEEASRPFEARRDGFVMGEGAGVLILEKLEHAQSRGAKIYCEIAAYDSSCDAFHITSPDPEGHALAKSFKTK